MTQNDKHKIPVIGITSGVGSGKSEVMNILKNEYNGAVILADNVGHELMEPGQVCYEKILAHFGEGILMEQDEEQKKTTAREIDRQKLGAIVFADEAQLSVLNDITHKAIREEILRRIDHYKQSGNHPFIAIEAALLIEDGYEDMLDQLWYIYARKDLRIRRLMDSRGYSEEKCQQIISQQLPDEVFFAHADVVIDNNGSMEEIGPKIKAALKSLLDKSC